MISLKLAILTIAISLHLTTAQRFGFGSCPQQSVEQNFNFVAFYGRWYEQLKYNNEYQLGSKCETRDYSPQGNGYLKMIHGRFLQFWGGFGFGDSLLGSLVTSGNPSEGKFDERFPILVNAAMKLWVLETDYTHYSIFWSCRDIFFMNRQYLWVYTRTKDPSEEVISELRRKISSRKLDVGPLRKTTQDCKN